MGGHPVRGARRLDLGMAHVTLLCLIRVRERGELAVLSSISMNCLVFIVELASLMTDSKGFL